MTNNYLITNNGAGVPLQAESTDDDDCHSNKSLDLNFGKKLIDFKLSTSSGPAQEEDPALSSASNPTRSTESQEEMSSAGSGSSPSSSSPALKQQPDYKHVCCVCRKSFRYATTLARHERAHLSEEAPAPAEETTEESPSKEEAAAESGEEKEEELMKEVETEEDEEGGVRGGDSEGGDSGDSEEEEKEKEERSDEEASEPKSREGGVASGRRLDKRKKICNVCGKRFWSLQDLTRHMRSHTGTPPRTFFISHTHVEPTRRFRRCSSFQHLLLSLFVCFVL